MSCEILFIYVPPYIPFLSDSTFPYLSGYLHKQGVQSRIIDLNIAFYKRLLTKAYLKKLGRQMEAQLPEAWSGERERGYAWLRALAALPWVSNSVEDAAAAMRDPDKFHDLHHYHHSRLVIKAAVEIANARFWPSKLSFWQFITGRSMLGDAMSPAAERESNMFLEFFEEAVQERIAPLKPAAVGITIPSPFHLPATLTLLQVIRRKLRDVKTILGGPIIESTREPAFYEIWLKYADVLVRGEGEPALFPLLESFQSHADLKKVPNIIYLKKGEVRESRRTEILNINTLPPPRYDDIDGRDYLSPETFFSITTSRGCYWHRCAFCSRTSVRDRFRERPVENVMDDIEFLIKQYSAGTFFLTDEVTSPSMLRKLSHNILDSGWDISWSTQTRCERIPSRKEAGEMRRSGCLHLILGIESHSSRILKRMNKGFDVPAIEKMIDVLQGAGIGVHTYAIVGFPGETREESVDTLMFLLQQNRKLGKEGFTFQVSPYVAIAGSSVTENPEKFGIKELELQSANLYGYRTESGYDQAGAVDLINRTFRKEMDLAGRFSRIYKAPCFAHKLLFLRRYPPLSRHSPGDRIMRFSSIALAKQDLADRFFPGNFLLVRETPFEWF